MLKFINLKNYLFYLFCIRQDLKKSDSNVICKNTTSQKALIFLGNSKEKGDDRNYKLNNVLQKSVK